MKPYIIELDVAAARLRFKINTKMTPTVQMNFQSDPSYTHQLWKCVGCSELNGTDIGHRDTEQHIISCTGYLHFRHNKNLDIDRDLVDYFRLVIKSRQDVILAQI